MCLLDALLHAGHGGSGFLYPNPPRRKKYWASFFINSISLQIICVAQHQVTRLKSVQQCGKEKRNNNGSGTPKMLINEV